MSRTASSLFGCRVRAFHSSNTGVLIGFTPEAAVDVYRKSAIAGICMFLTALETRGDFRLSQLPRPTSLYRLSCWSESRIAIFRIIRRRGRAGQPACARYMDVPRRRRFALHILGYLQLCKHQLHTRSLQHSGFSCLLVSQTVHDSGCS